MSRLSFVVMPIFLFFFYNLNPVVRTTLKVSFLSRIYSRAANETRRHSASLQAWRTFKKNNKKGKKKKRKSSPIGWNFKYFVLWVCIPESRHNGRRYEHKAKNQCVSQVQGKELCLGCFLVSVFHQRTRRHALTHLLLTLKGFLVASNFSSFSVTFIWICIFFFHFIVSNFTLVPDFNCCPVNLTGFIISGFVDFFFIAANLEVNLLLISPLPH